MALSFSDQSSLPEGGASLEEVHETVETSEKKGFWRKLMAFVGPAYLVSVGYMDPGNWATDLAGGSQFGYKLIWVLLMSNLIALLLQSLSARLGIVRRRDLAQASRESYPKLINYFLYFLAEVAIAATDLAEVVGMAIGLQLLFDLPLLIGVSITVLDTFLFLFLQRLGIRKMEAFILALIGVIGLSFLIEVVLARPEPAEVAKGFIPSLPNEQALYIAIGIIGATVMPHNLYLHSALVQTRKIRRTPRKMREALRFNVIDSLVALNLAFLVNAAILVLAAATFFQSGMFHVAEIQDAHQLLERFLGTQWAPILFAVALIAAGQSSTITGTLAGQIVMEGYLNLRLQPWLRRLITRLIAIVPAFLVIWLMGEEETGPLLVLSQVVLSLQLGFAIIPLIHFVSDPITMGTMVINRGVKILAWVSALIIVVLNAKLTYEEISAWMVAAGDQAIWLWLTVVPLAVFAGGVLLYITFQPLFQPQRKPYSHMPHGGDRPLVHLPELHYRRIAIALDFSSVDPYVLQHALSQGEPHTEYLLIHVVETVGALVMGRTIRDLETATDRQYLEAYAEQLKEKGYKVHFKLGYGSPKTAIADLAQEWAADLLVMGGHGHRLFKDILFGTTIEDVRHRVTMPVLVVREP
ncbi:manganese transport protein [Catalinimonas alkaloidigena]|uniref:Divalent metal cation transporter MntH n=1 Tax=Catalinimonas alkaloidigena TaxID=1075417 RepID=A0A1G9KS57_9BACT|nr:Nramp family divalent metal transporter [Catalinimonas alkaloidigena]SDL52640.1 manganese transport protein [Catalinimonas alkaloidigena]